MNNILTNMEIQQTKNLSTVTNVGSQVVEIFSANKMEWLNQSGILGADEILMFTQIIITRHDVM